MDLNKSEERKHNNNFDLLNHQQAKEKASLLKTP